MCKHNSAQLKTTVTPAVAHSVTYIIIDLHGGPEKVNLMNYTLTISLTLVGGVAQW